MADGNNKWMQLILQDPETFLNTYKGEDINYQNGDGVTLLHYASQNVDILTFLLGFDDIDVNLQDVGGDSALGEVIRESNGDESLEIVKALLAHPDIDVNVQNLRGHSILMTACDYGYNDEPLEIVKALLAHPDIDVNLGQTGETPLELIVCGQGSLKMAEALLSHPDINTDNLDKLCILSIQPDLFRKILKRNPNWGRFQNEKTLLHVLIDKQQYEKAKIYMEFKPDDVDLEDDSQHNALEHALLNDAPYDLIKEIAYNSYTTNNRIPLYAVSSILDDDDKIYFLHYLKRKGFDLEQLYDVVIDGEEDRYDLVTWAAKHGQFDIIKRLEQFVPSIVLDEVVQYIDNETTLLKLIDMFGVEKIFIKMFRNMPVKSEYFKLMMKLDEDVMKKYIDNVLLEFIYKDDVEYVWYLLKFVDCLKYSDDKQFFFETAQSQEMKNLLTGCFGDGNPKDVPVKEYVDAINTTQNIPPEITEMIFDRVDKFDTLSLIQLQNEIYRSTAAVQDPLYRAIKDDDLDEVKQLIGQYSNLEKYLDIAESVEMIEFLEQKNNRRDANRKIESMK